MVGDLIAFMAAMDRCWIERRPDDLADYIADDVVMVAPGGQNRFEGLAAAIDSYRAFMDHARVERYATSGHVVTIRGDSAVVEYDWEMGWESDGASFDATGREILVLASRDGHWRVIWRTQIPA